MTDEIISILINRYDYSGACAIARSQGREDSLAKMLDICRHMVNFDFITAQKLLTDYGEDFPLEISAALEKNLMDLIYGEPNAIFSEHLANMYFQMEREEYIDLLGRIYRFNEAFLKFLFIKEHQKVLSIYDDIFEEGRALRILKRRYKIYNGNIIFAVVEYIHKHSRKPTLKRCANFITSPGMKALADLRNASIVGHGFEAVSYYDIKESYGEPQVLLKDIELIMIKGGLEIETDKYKTINNYLLKELRDEEE